MAGNPVKSSTLATLDILCAAVGTHPVKSSMDIPGHPGYAVCSSEHPALRNKTAATAWLHPSSVAGVEFQVFP